MSFRLIRQGPSVGSRIHPYPWSKLLRKGPHMARSWSKELARILFHCAAALRCRSTPSLRLLARCFSTFSLTDRINQKRSVSSVRSSFRSEKRFFSHACNLTTRLSSCTLRRRSRSLRSASERMFSDFTTESRNTTATASRDSLIQAKNDEGSRMARSKPLVSRSYEPLVLPLESVEGDTSTARTMSTLDSRRTFQTSIAASRTGEAGTCRSCHK
mmetsp:Transcript_12684/g.20711  ORF Transcript_12684/g.20711 Transcript_12684/m.20711 type:complete len:215 (+) Transcript_12684:71-715(+)